MEVLGLLYIPNWLLYVVILVSAYVIYMTKNHRKFKSRGIKGPPPIPVFGNFITMMRKGITIAEREWYMKYGEVFGIYEGRMPVLMVSNPDMLREMLVKQFSNFCSRRVLVKNNQSPLDSMLTIIEDEEHWRHVRNVMSPTFSGGKLKRMNELLNSACKRLVTNIEQQVEDKDDIEIKLTCGNFTMDVTASVAFGIQVDSQVNPNDRFVVNGKKFFQFRAWVVTMIFFFPFLVDLLLLFGISVFATDAVDFFKNVVTETIRQRKAGGGQSNKDFLQLMIDQQEQKGENGKIIDRNEDGSWSRTGLTIDEIYGQSILFFAAGFETTAATLSMIFYLLTLHPDVCDKVMDEVDRVVGKSETITYEQTTELNYLEQVIQEVQRLYPAAVRFDRTCTTTTTVNGITIEKGDVVAVPLAAIQRNPEFWPEPEKFDPDRFTPEKKAERNPFHFMPFGYGPRNCIGMRLALLELKMGLAAVLHKFRPVKCPRTQEHPVLSKIGLLSIKGGSWIRLEKRQA